MKLSHEIYDDAVVVSINGELTADDLEPFRRLVQERLDAGTRDFVLDVAETEFIDSKGLETILWLQETAGERLGQLRLSAPSENVGKILQVTRLDNQFDTHKDVDEAVKSLR